MTVGTQPGPISETCSVSNGSGTTGTSDVTNVIVACALNTFTVGGNVSGLPSGSIVSLLNRGADAQAIDGSAAFVFSPQADGTNYDVTVGSQPPGFDCTVTNGSGTLPGGTNVSDVAVVCAALPQPSPIPTLPLWMLALLGSLVAGIGAAVARKKPRS